VFVVDEVRVNVGERLDGCGGVSHSRDSPLTLALSPLGRGDSHFSVEEEG